MSPFLTALTAILSKTYHSALTSRHCSSQHSPFLFSDLSRMIIYHHLRFLKSLEMPIVQQTTRIDYLVLHFEDDCIEPAGSLLSVRDVHQVCYRARRDIRESKQCERPLCSTSRC